jgi:hypothetical protein
LIREKARVIGLPPAHKENKVQSEAMKVFFANLLPFREGRGRLFNLNSGFAAKVIFDILI